MAIGVIWQPPIDRQTYDAVKEKVFQAAQDNGCTFHAAGEFPGGWRIIEVWESRDGLDSFIRGALYPVIDEVSGGQAQHPEPEVFDVHFQVP
jgi:hypothetical protein